MLLRYSYAHLLRRMRHSQVDDGEKTMIALRLVGSDLGKNGLNIQVGDRKDAYIANIALPGTPDELERKIDETMADIRLLRELKN